MNDGVLPIGTTIAEIETVAARFGAYSRRQMHAAADRVQQTVEWVRDEPWTEEDATNFFITCMSELGSSFEREGAGVASSAGAEQEPFT